MQHDDVYDYDVLSDCDPVRLSRLVRIYIVHGWAPLSAPYLGHSGRHCQAMICLEPDHDIGTLPDHDFPIHEYDDAPDTHTTTTTPTFPTSTPSTTPAPDISSSTQPDQDSPVRDMLASH